MEQESATPKSNFILIFLTGFVSLVVGVGSGLLINYLTEKRPKLTYDITTQEVFPGEQNNIGIFALRISNDGKSEIEQVFCHLWFPAGKMTERRVVGIPDSARTVDGVGNNIEVSVPFLNPGEQFSIQVLLADVSEPLGRPSVEIRGKGILGAEAQSQGSPSKPLSQWLSLAGSVLATLVTAFIFLGTRHLSSRLSGFHSADQRDTIAFALDTKGLPDDAKTIREWPRDLTYWAASDVLANKWLQTGNLEEIQKGVDALDFLGTYAAISSDSKRIVLLNMSRLAIALKNVELAKRYLAAARAKKDGIIEKRILADSTFVSIEPNRPI